MRKVFELEWNETNAWQSHFAKSIMDWITFYVEQKSSFGNPTVKDITPAEDYTTEFKHTKYGTPAPEGEWCSCAWERHIRFVDTRCPSCHKPIKPPEGEIERLELGHSIDSTVYEIVKTVNNLIDKVNRMGRGR